MPHLQSNAGLASLGVSATSKVFSCTEGVLHVYIGGTASTGTLTLQSSRSQSSGFSSYVVDNTSGTPTTQAFTSAQVAPSTVYHACYLEHGMYFRFVTDSANGQAWEIEVNGDNVTIHE